jgi:hypothetical protein
MGAMGATGATGATGVTDAAGLGVSKPPTLAARFRLDMPEPRYLESAQPPST